jgi:hypothetical protein
VSLWAWATWSIVFVVALLVFRRAGLLLPEALRRVGWLVPMVAVFAVPAALLAPAEEHFMVGAALSIRALSAAAMGAAVATWLGPSGLVRAVRHLRLPARLEARRPGFGAWSDLFASPRDTVRGFGRLVASLLLRSLERAEALEQARRARGGAA